MFCLLEHNKLTKLAAAGPVVLESIFGVSLGFLVMNLYPAHAHTGPGVIQVIFDFLQALAVRSYSNTVFCYYCTLGRLISC